MKLRLTIVILIFFTFLSVGKSQVGINFMGKMNTYKTWNDLLYKVYPNRHKLSHYSFGGGVNYWLGLSYYRLEFTPGLYYLYADTNISYNQKDVNFQVHNLGVEVAMNAYIFDFIRKNYKRDCPSFSRDGQWLKKSFFVQVSTALYRSFKQIKDVDIDLKSDNLAGEIGFGIGVDIPIFQYFVVAPVIKYGFYVGEKWEGISEYYLRDNFYDSTSGSYISLSFNFYLR